MTQDQFRALRFYTKLALCSVPYKALTCVFACAHTNTPMPTGANACVDPGMAPLGPISHRNNSQMVPFPEKAPEKEAKKV